MQQINIRTSPSAGQELIVDASSKGAMQLQLVKRPACHLFLADGSKQLAASTSPKGIDSNPVSCLSSDVPKTAQRPAPPTAVVSTSEANSILSREDSDTLPRDTALRKDEEASRKQRGDAKVMLLEALKKGDFELSLSLLANAGAEEVSFVRFKKGSWAERTNESAIHHALFHLHKAIKEEDALKWYELVLELIRKGGNKKKLQQAVREMITRPHQTPLVPPRSTV